MRSIRFHDYGEATDVLVYNTDVERPKPAATEILVRVHACGLNPADWALCKGLFPGSLPRGIGLEVSGIVEGVGQDVSEIDAVIGDRVMGAIRYTLSSAGASEYACLHAWAKVPKELDMDLAASLTMATETAYRSLEALDVEKGDTVLVHGAGTTVGFAAAQICRFRGVRVIATMGATHARALRDKGILVTSYGEGMVDRVRQLSGGRLIDKVLDTAPPPHVLPELVELAGGLADRVLTVSNCADADSFGVKNSLKQTVPLQYGVLQEYVNLAAEGKYTIPIAKRFSLDEWREAVTLSIKGEARGKVLITVR